MTVKHSLLAALLGALLSTAAFAQGLGDSYNITGSGTAFTVTKNGSTMPLGQPNRPLDAAIEAIRADACRDTPAAVSFFIIFGPGGSDALDIGTATATFGGGGVNWCSFILQGKITSAVHQPLTGESMGTVDIKTGVNLKSIANIANTNGPAITMRGGNINIYGGTVEGSRADGSAVEYPINGGGGKVTLGGSPTITGYIQVPAGALGVITAHPSDPVFNPGEKKYKIWISGTAGDVAVVNGAGYASNFRLELGGIGLVVRDNDLVLAAPNYSSSSLTPSSSSAGGSSSSAGGSSSSAGGNSSSSETTPIAHSPLPAVHSQAPAYYNIKGEPVGSSKPATPGVYLVKQGSSIRKVVVR